MGTISRYIFRTTFSAFVIVLVTITALIWSLQALRYIDLVTNRGQTILAFLSIASLIIPFLTTTIAPIALLIATLYTLNKLANDSELVSMKAAGMSPWQLSRAFMLVALVVSLYVFASAAHFGPRGLQMLRDQITKVNSDVVSAVAKPNRFTTIQSGVTLFIRARHADGRLIGVLIEDRRDPAERVTLIAESGTMPEQDDRSFLHLQNGVLQRQKTNDQSLTMVEFDRYTFDLSQFTNNNQKITYSIREHYLWDLFFPNPNDQSYKAQPDQFRAELYDRLIAPFYSIAFTIIALACFCVPRTNRQKPTALIAQAIGWAALLRMLGVICRILGTSSPWTLALPYAAMAVVFSVGLFIASTGGLPTTASFRYLRRS